jgi:hypothetical protein
MEGRRAILAGLSAALVGFAGCGSGAATGTHSAVAPDRPPCADGVRIVDREERIARGTVPEVTFRLRNDGDVAVAYDLRVGFEQATSTGLREPSGRDRIVGTLAPGASVTVTATTDSEERTSTTDYTLGVVLSCPEAAADV